MLGHPRHQTFIGRRSDEDRYARALSVAQSGQHGLFIGEAGGVDLDRLGQVVFQRRPAAEQPKQQLKDAQGMATEIGEGGLDQQIRSQQGAVEIDHQGARGTASRRRVLVCADGTIGRRAHALR